MSAWADSDTAAIAAANAPPASFDVRFKMRAPLVSSDLLTAYTADSLSLPLGFRNRPKAALSKGHADGKPHPWNQRARGGMITVAIAASTSASAANSCQLGRSPS